MMKLGSKALRAQFCAVLMTIFGGLSVSGGPVAAGDTIATKFIDPESVSADFNRNAKRDGLERSADSIIELFLPLMRGHPESLEGKARSRLSIEKRLDQSGFVVELVQTGYADDSVAGERFVGFVSHTNGKWVLDSLWQQQLCYRGATPQEWTKTRCP